MRPRTRTKSRDGRRSPGGAEDAVVANGVDGSTGGYLLPPLTPRQIALLARGLEPKDEHFQDLKTRYRSSLPSV